MNEFKPGDRVQYGTTEQHLQHYRGLLGTVRTVVDNLSVGVAWDTMSGVSDHTPSYLIRQPIEPGCWVREVPGSNVVGGQQPFKYIGPSDRTGRATVKGVLIPFDTDMTNLIRVTDPIPGSISANALHVTSLSASVTDPAHLKQAQTLLTTLHARHYPDKPLPHKANTLPDVLDQIDNVTAGLAPSNIGDALDRRNRKIAELQQERDNLRDTNNVINEKLKQSQYQIGSLAAFIASEIHGEPSASEGAVDTAIRVMRRHEAALTSAVTILREWEAIRPGGPKTRAWLSEYDPTPAPITLFTRGDLVTWGAGAYHGRIVGPAPSKDAPFEVIITARAKGGSDGQAGRFITPELGNLRHVTE